jgi:hypothetical protein
MSTTGRSAWPIGPVIRIESSYAVANSNCDLLRLRTDQVVGRVQINRPRPPVKEFEDIRDYFKSKS